MDSSSRNAKAWIIDASGRKEFSGYTLKKRQVTLTLAPGEMVLIQG